MVFLLWCLAMLDIFMQCTAHPALRILDRCWEHSQVKRKKKSRSKHLRFSCFFVDVVCFCFLSALIGLVRVLSGWALLKQRGVDRELYVLAALSFAVEIARDAQMGRLAAGLDSVALGISSALLLWMSVAAKTHVRTSV